MHTFRAITNFTESQYAVPLQNSSVSSYFWVYKIFICSYLRILGFIICQAEVCFQHFIMSKSFQLWYERLDNCQKNQFLMSNTFTIFFIWSVTDCSIQLKKSGQDFTALCHTETKFLDDANQIHTSLYPNFVIFFQFLCVLWSQ